MSKPKVFLYAAAILFLTGNALFAQVEPTKTDTAAQPVQVPAAPAQAGEAPKQAQSPAVQQETRQQQAPASAEPPKAQPAPASGQDSQSLLEGAKNFRLGNYEEAVAELTKAREQDPTSAVAAYYLGATLKKMQLFEKSVPHLKAAVMLQPPVRQAFLELADTYYAMGRLDEALAALVVAEQDRLDPGQTAFLKGLVLMKKRIYPDALASFENAKKSDLTIVSACDFQIASIYLRLGKQAQARDLFQSVAERDPESDVGQMSRQQADALTARLEAKSAFTVAVNIQEQYDSNVILKPDLASSDTASISGASDMVTALSVRAEYAPVIKLPYGLKFQYSGYLSSHQKEKSYDMQNHAVGATPSYRMGENSISMPVTYSYTLLENAKYLSATSLAPTYAFVTGEDQFAQASITYQKKNYLQPPAYPEENRNSSDVDAGISWTRVIAQQKGAASLKYDLNKEKAVGTNWSYLGNKLGASVLYPYQDRIKLTLALEAYRQAYDHVHSTYDIKRADTSYTASAQAVYALSRTMDAQLQYLWNKNESNIPVYGYHKNVVSIGLSARF